MEACCTVWELECRLVQELWEPGTVAALASLEEVLVLACKTALEAPEAGSSASEALVACKMVWVELVLVCRSALVESNSVAWAVVHRLALVEACKQVWLVLGCMSALEVVAYMWAWAGAWACTLAWQPLLGCKLAWLVEEADRQEPWEPHMSALALEVVDRCELEGVQHR